MFKRKIIIGMVCSLFLITVLFLSGCVENVKTSERKDLDDILGNLVIVEPDSTNLGTFYLCILDQDGIIYYPIHLNEHFANFTNESNELFYKAFKYIRENNITNVAILFSAERRPDFDINDKIGRPIRLTKLKVISRLPEDRTSGLNIFYDALEDFV